MKLQETVFDLLTQEYELSRIEEAKSIPTISVIDPPTWPEKKSFPPRLIIMLVGTLFSAMISFFSVARGAQWRALDDEDARKHLVRTMLADISKDHPKWIPKKFVHRNGHDH